MWPYQFAIQVCPCCFTFLHKVSSWPGLGGCWPYCWLRPSAAAVLTSGAAVGGSCSLPHPHTSTRQETGDMGHGMGTSSAGNQWQRVMDHWQCSCEKLSVLTVTVDQDKFHHKLWLNQTMLANNYWRPPNKKEVHKVKQQISSWR